MAERKLKLAVFISGRGSNMMALARACERPDYPAELSVVLSNNPEAEGVLWAKEKGLQVEIVDHRDFSSKAAFEQEILVRLNAYDVDLICLAGFMRLLSAAFVEKWRNKLINIHPSLLPDFKGLDTHARVIASGGARSGCTVHFVRPEMDEGPVIAQYGVPVFPNDSVETLAARVLKQEHIAYPEAVALIAEGKVKVVNERVEFI